MNFPSYHSCSAEGNGGPVSTSICTKRPLEEEPDTNAVASVATFYSPFVTPFGCPRQGSVCPSTRGKIELKEWLVKGKMGFLDGLEAYSHLWVLFFFDKKAECSFDERTSFLNPTVRAPRALKDPAAPKQFGVFATRSPHRPNPIGQTVVKIDYVDHANNRIFVSGVDICDGTQILDLKPYHFADAAPLFQGILDGVGGAECSGMELMDPNQIKPGDGCRFPPWVAANMSRWRILWAPHTLDVLQTTTLRFYPDERDKGKETDVTLSVRQSIEEVLATDVRTAELKDPNRIWGVYFDCLNIRFRQCAEDAFEVICLEKRS